MDHGIGVIVGSHKVAPALNELADVAVTHLRVGSFQPNLYSFIGQIKERGVISPNYGVDDKVFWVYPRDIATTVTEESTTFSSGTNVRYVASEEMRAGFKQRGRSTSVANLLVNLNASIHNGKMGEAYEKHKSIMDKVKVEDFAEEFAAFNEV